MKNTLFSILVLFVFCCNSAFGQTQTLADAKKMLAEASKQYKVLPANFIILVPPIIDVKCGELNRIQSQQIKDYTYNFQAPENLIIQKILSAGKIFSGLKDQTNADAAMSLACQVSGRLQKKAIYGLKGYGGDIHYSLPMCIAALAVEKDANMLSCGGNTIIEMVATKFGEVEKLILNELKKEHDYSLIQTFVYYEKQRALLTGVSDAISFEQDLSDALTFKIQIDQELQYYYEGKLMGTYKANGTSNVSWSNTGNINNQITGNGKMKLTSCWKTELCQKEQSSDETPCTSNCDLESYKTGNTVLRIDACNNHELSLLFVGFGGPYLEHWTRCIDENTGYCGSYRLNAQRNREVSKMSTKTDAIFIESGIEPPVSEQYSNPDGDYSKFIIPLQNNTPEIGTLQFVKMSKDKEWVLKLEFKIVHTPK